MSQLSFIEVQFPIGYLSLESYLERLPYVGKPLNSLGKWWGVKPLVLIRAIILGAVFPAANDSAYWPDDLAIFLKCMCMDPDGMWRRKTTALPARLCYSAATDEEREVLFLDESTWKSGKSDPKARHILEKRVFYAMDYKDQREYCCRIEEIDGPAPEVWEAINAHLKTTATSLPELIQELAHRRWGTRLKVGDAFSGAGSIPFEAAELGCDVYASDLNPVAGLLTWGALNLIGGTPEFRQAVHAEQHRLYSEMDVWLVQKGLENSAEGWRAEAWLYCVEIQIPEWDNWRVPLCPGWIIAPKTETWVELVPVEAEKRFDFRVCSGGEGYSQAAQGTKQGADVVCPQPLWDMFKHQKRHVNMPRLLPYNQLLENAGGLRRWEKRDFQPRTDDVLQERLYAIRWRLPNLKTLLDEEQALRDHQSDSNRLLEIDRLFKGLHYFFNDSDWEVLEGLRQLNWNSAREEIADLEDDIARLRGNRAKAEAVKELRLALKEKKTFLQAQEVNLARLAGLVPRLVYREPQVYDLNTEIKVLALLEAVFDHWQAEGWIPAWRIEPGYNTTQPIRERGWTYWHHLFTPRQLLMAGSYSKHLADCPFEIRAAMTLTLGRILEANARLTRWKPKDGGGIGGTVSVYYNQALNTMLNYATRSWKHLYYQALPCHQEKNTGPIKSVCVCDARDTTAHCNLWITDPPYADAVNYEELSEFFLAWYAPHLKATFPDWPADSMRPRAIKGNDAPFRLAMAECYRRLAEQMPEDGLQVLMFTHKSTDVWEDIALIMWAAGLQVRQVWSVATETPGAGIRTGNYVQATYNMVLRRRTGNRLGLAEQITPLINQRVTQVITQMQNSQIESHLARCGYTDTDYLLAGQAAAAEVITGFATIEGVDLDAELRTPNARRGRSRLRILMENAKRTAADFLVPGAVTRAVHRKPGVDAAQFWRALTPEEKFIFKGLELEQQGVFKIGAFQDLGRVYGLGDYEALLGPVQANNTRTRLPAEFPRADMLRYADIPPEARAQWRFAPLRHTYHVLKLQAEGADRERAVKHLTTSTNFHDLRARHLPILLMALREITAALPHWEAYQTDLAALILQIENWRD